MVHLQPYTHYLKLIVSAINMRIIVHKDHLKVYMQSMWILVHPRCLIYQMSTTQIRNLRMQKMSPTTTVRHISILFHFLSCLRIQLNRLFNFLDFHSARHTSNPVLNNSPRTPTLGAGRIDASGRINRWRQGGFPPVMPRYGNFPTRFCTQSTTTSSTLPTSPIASSTAASEGLEPTPTIPTLPLHRPRQIHQPKLLYVSSS
jgi:hypothetical protein